MPHYRWSPLTDRTFREAAEEGGAAVEHLLVFEESMGSRPPDPEDRVRQDVLEMLPAVRTPGWPRGR